MDKICSIIQTFLTLVVSKEHIKQRFFFFSKPKLFGVNPVNHINIFLPVFKLILTHTFIILNPINSPIIFN